MPLTPASTVIVEPEMDFRTLLALFWRSAPLMIVIIFCCVLLASVYVVIAQKWYQAEVVLVPAEEKSIPLIPGQLGGLAALAGISIGGDGMEIEALAVLRSRDFAREFIEALNLETVILNQRKRTALLPALNSVSRLQDIDDAVEYLVRTRPQAPERVFSGSYVPLVRSGAGHLHRAPGPRRRDQLRQSLLAQGALLPRAAQTLSQLGREPGAPDQDLGARGDGRLWAYRQIAFAHHAANAGNDRSSGRVGTLAHGLCRDCALVRSRTVAGSPQFPQPG